MNDASLCPVCHVNPAQVAPAPGGDATNIACQCCGSFVITDSAESVLRKRKPDPRLIAWIRRQSEAGDQPTINSSTSDLVVATAPGYSVAEKQLLLLQWLAKTIKVPGGIAKMRPPLDWPVIWGSGQAELSFHLGTAKDRGLIKHLEGDGHLIVELTAAGWERLDQAAGELVFEDRAFVAMWFDSSMAPAWVDGFVPGIGAAGYRALRVDSIPHLDRIDLKIIGDIRASRFVVADVTGQRPGVYFEAGYALALGRPVVWTVRADEQDKIHFDTRQFNHIIWSTPQDLATQLEAVIAGAIGRRKQTNG